MNFTGKILASLILISAFTSPIKAGDFWSTWGDGKAELNGYKLTQPRYGQIRQGKAVLIFVTEDHSTKEMVKIEGDPERVPKNERFPVLKLNFVKTFQTGIYDYKVMTSVFTRIDKNFEPSKISLGLQEWCGHVYHQLVSTGQAVRETLHSYFGGEADQERQLALPSNVVFEDAVPILIRELRGEWLKPGGALEAPSAPSLVSLRFAHKPFSWGKIRVKKAAAPEKFKSIFGETPVIHWTVQTVHAGTYDYLVEAEMPHRILKWSSDQGEEAVITGSARLPYWKLHDEGDEKYLKQIF